MENWQPPLPISLQAIIMTILSGVVGVFMNPTKEGFVTGLLTGTIAFWGRGIFAEIEEIKDANNGIKKEENDNDAI